MTTTYADLKTRVLQLAGETTGTKYADTLVQEAFRQALSDYSMVVPQVKEYLFTVITTGRDQALTAIVDALYFIGIIYPYTSTAPDVLTKDLQFYSTLGGPTIHFSGDTDTVPIAGQQILVKYAASHLIKDLDSATTTTLPVKHEDIFALGAAAHAMTIRMQTIIEQYGGRTADADRLEKQAQTYYAEFKSKLSGLVNFQPNLGFPEGFRLDEWDKV